ncbi:hypothetical protein SSCG_01734 [Streptomyces clavuligerus]|nr:hypothetical protein SSCG_01734 [Streptomyces clavuligerus]
MSGICSIWRRCSVKQGSARRRARGGHPPEAAAVVGLTVAGP